MELGKTPGTTVTSIVTCNLFIALASEFRCLFGLISKVVPLVFQSLIFFWPLMIKWYQTITLTACMTCFHWFHNSFQFVHEQKWGCIFGLFIFSSYSYSVPEGNDSPVQQLDVFTLLYVYRVSLYLCLCVCVCVCERLKLSFTAAISLLIRGSVRLRAITRPLLPQ